MRVADEAERRFGREVVWSGVCGQTRQIFTSLSVPVMPRLCQPERQVLDTDVRTDRLSRLTCVARRLTLPL